MRISKSKDGIVEIDMEDAIVIDTSSSNSPIVDIRGDASLSNVIVYSNRKDVCCMRLEHNARAYNVHVYSNSNASTTFQNKDYLIQRCKKNNSIVNIAKKVVSVAQFIKGIDETKETYETTVGEVREGFRTDLFSYEYWNEEQYKFYKNNCNK